MFRSKLRWLAMVLLLMRSLVWAAPDEEQNRKAFADAEAAAKKGPTHIELSGQAVLTCPPAMCSCRSRRRRVSSTRWATRATTRGYRA